MPFTISAAFAEPPVFVERVADGTYVHFGDISVTTGANMGDIANLGIIVGRDAAAVIDTGGSAATGQAMLAALRRITDKPLRYVINTHEHPDHVFGNAALEAPGVVFAGHRNLAESIRAHGPFYLHAFTGILGADAMRHIRLVTPGLQVDGTTELDLGDRKLMLTAWPPPAHSDCDLTVLDERSGILFTGDLVFLDHVPVVDGGVKGWLTALDGLAKLPATRVVPGHGRRLAPWPEALTDTRRYLETIQHDARAALAAGTPLARAVDAIGLAEQDRWRLFDDYNRRNATAVFSELEWE
jgi:quinoprotein relay system zinc metallohydrolase 2